MKTLITGAQGFLGTELVQLLAQDHELYCLTRGALPPNTEQPSIHWIQMDLSEGLDESKLPDNLDAIIHLAQSNAYRDFPEGADDVFAVNVGLVQSLCAYGRKVGISQMLLASSGTVYEPFDGEMSESSAVFPTSHYGASKLAAELLSNSYSAHFSVCNLRIFFLYGPNQKGMLISRLVEAVKTGSPVYLPRDKKGLLFCPTFVTDAAEVFAQALNERWSATYNLASPHDTEMGDLLKILSDVSGQPLNLVVTDTPSPAPIVPDLTKLSHMVDLDSFTTPSRGLALTD